MSLSGDRIRELRIQHDMTLDDVAKYLGINRQAVYKYEQGIVTNIPLDKIEKMAILFDTTPDYIAGWSEEKPLYSPIFETSTAEARIISGGINRMPPDKREQALKIMQAAFVEYADYFKEDENK
jgi:transcriptional regulator with XRE-family HTH domain